MATKQNTVEKLIVSWLANLPNFYEDAPTSNNYKVGEFLANNFLTFLDNAAKYDSSDMLENGLKAALLVSTSTGTYLDDIGALFRMHRDSGESDVDFRTRILGNWVGFSGGGTAEDFKRTISIVSGVAEDDIVVSETRDVTNDTISFSTGTPTYSLTNHSIVKDTVVVTGTVSSSPYTFIENTDFTLDYGTGEITFEIGGTDPDNSSSVEIDYTYLNDMKVAITANIGLSANSNSTISIINDLIPQIKAAGVYVKTILSSNFSDTIGSVSEGTPTYTETFYIHSGHHSAGDDYLV